MLGLMRNLRYAIRVLGRSRGFAAVAVVALALGIGANTAIFSVVDGVLLRPYSFPDLDRIVTLWETVPSVGAERHAVSAANFLDWASQARAFFDIAAYKDWNAALTGGREPEAVRAFHVSPGFFRVLGAPAWKGRVFTGTEAAEPSAVVVSYGFWRQRLGSDPAVVGKTLVLNDSVFTIIGVLPDDLAFPLSADLWAPLIIQGPEKSERAKRDLRVIAPLKPEWSVRASQAEMNALSAHLEKGYPLENAGRRASVVLLRDTVSLRARAFLFVLLAAVGFVLLLACANVANLQLARYAARERETAVRAALGAGRLQMASYVFAESLLLSLAGGMAGTALGAWGVELIKNNIPPIVARNLPGAAHIAVNGRVLAFTLGVSLLTAVLFALPGMLNTSTARLYALVKEGGRASSAPRSRRFQSALVIVQVGLALLLLIGCGLMVRAFGQLSTIARGYDPANLLTSRVTLADRDYASPHSVTGFYDEVLRNLRALPGAESAAAASELPSLGTICAGAVIIEGHPATAIDRPNLAEIRVITDDFFRSFNLRLREGREFSSMDAAATNQSAVVSEDAARRFWPGRDAIGRRFRLAAGMQEPWIKVVGIADNVNHFALDPETRPTIYLSHWQRPAKSMYLVLRTNSGTTTTAAAMRSVVGGVDPRTAMHEIREMNTLLAELSGAVGLIAGLMTAFAGVALALSATGVYAVMAYSVAERRHEISVRMALGAVPADIRNMVLGSALRLTAIGLGMGLLAAIGLARALPEVLTGIVRSEPAVFVVFTVVLGAVGLFAAYWPARRATKVNALLALR